MKRINQLVVMAVITICTGTTLTVFGDDDHDAGKIIPVTQVPAVVINVAKRLITGIKITGAEKEKNDDMIIYELKGNAAGKEYEIKVSSQGKLLKSGEIEEDEHEKGKEIALSEVPATVKSIVDKTVPGIKLTDAEIEKAGAVTIYELEGCTRDYEYELKVTQAGKVIKVKKEKIGFLTRLWHAIF